MCKEGTIARIHARRKLVQAAAVKIDFDICMKMTGDDFLARIHAI
jgi:hypothetical protein